MELKKLVKVDYEYKVDASLDRDGLRKDIMKHLTKTKEVPKYVTIRLAKNLWQEYDELQMQQVNDEAHQLNYLEKLARASLMTKYDHRVNDFELKSPEKLLEEWKENSNGDL